MKRSHESRSILALVAACALFAACEKKRPNKPGPPPKPVEAPRAVIMGQMDLGVFPVIMRAPQGAKVDGDRDGITVTAGPGFGLAIAPAALGGVEGRAMIPEMERPHIRRRVVDLNNIQIWEKDMAGRTALHFALRTIVDGQEYEVGTVALGIYTREQVDVMISCARSMKNRLVID